MKMTKVLASIALLTAVGTTVAKADFKDFNQLCSPGAFKVCASLEVFTTLNISGGTDVIIRVRNLAGSYFLDNSGGSLITRIGIVAPVVNGTSNGSLTVTAIGGASSVGSPSPLWFLRDPGALGGPIELTAGIAALSNNGGIAGCSAPFGGYPGSYFSTCSAGSFIEFKFSTSNAWLASQSEVAWLTTSEAANGNRGEECGSSFSGTRSLCTQVTPEPVTMLLLGSGLAGMSGFGFIRRRKNEENIG